MTRTEFATCLALIEAAVGRDFTADQTEVWFKLLGDLPPESLQAGITRCLLESEYPGLPPIGRVRRLATEHSHGVPAAAEQAFARVREAVSRYGYNQPAQAAAFLGPAIWQVVEGIGGWARICDSPVDQRQSLFAQFRDGWQRVAAREQSDNLLPENIRPRQRVEGQQAALHSGPHPAVAALADATWQPTRRIAHSPPEPRRVTTKEAREAIEAVEITPEQQSEFDARRQEQLKALKGIS